MNPALRMWRWPALAITALALAVAVYALLPGPPPSVTGATPVRTGPFLVTVKGIEPRQPGLPLTDPANHWIAIVATVEVTSTHSWPALPALLRLRDTRGLVSPEPRIHLLRDASTAGPLQPGVAEELVFCWEQRSSEPLPELATVDIDGYAELAASATGQRQWARSGTAATVSVQTLGPAK